MGGAADLDESSRVQRLVGAAKKLPLPEGTYAIGSGLVILGLTAYAFQILAAKGLSPGDYSALNILWAIVFVVTPGLFQPLEQEVARALSHRRARGLGGGPLIKRATYLGGALAIIVILGSFIAYKPIVNELFNGRGSLMIGLAIAIVGYYIAYLVRGSLSGNGRFAPYGLLLGAEGLSRIILTAIVFAIGSKSSMWWGIAFALPPIIAVAVALPRQRGLVTPGPDAPYSEISGALALLLLGSIFAQALSYIAVLGVQLLATDHQRSTITAGFITGVFIARIPLLMFQAIQAALLPRLARLAGEGKTDDFKAGMMRLVAIVLGVCLTGTIAAGLIGPFVGEKLFKSKWIVDHHDILGNRDMFLLTLAVTLFITALTVAQGLIALKAYRQNAIAWIAGVATFCVTVAIAGHNLFLRNEIAFVAGGLIATVLASTFLAGAVKRGTAHLEDLVEVIEHEPLEI